MDQIHWKLRIWSYLQKKFLTENFIFCAVYYICYMCPVGLTTLDKDED